MMFALLMASALIAFGFFVTSPHWLNTVARKLYLPCRVRVHKCLGLSSEEDVVVSFDDQRINPWRFNVDVTLDGFIVAYHGRF